MQIYRTWYEEGYNSELDLTARLSCDGFTAERKSRLAHGQAGCVPIYLEVSFLLVMYIVSATFVFPLDSCLRRWCVSSSSSS